MTTPDVMKCAEEIRHDFVTGKLRKVVYQDSRPVDLVLSPGNFAPLFNQPAGTEHVVREAVELLSQTGAIDIPEPELVREASHGKKDYPALYRFTATQR